MVRRRVPLIKWERLAVEDVAREYERRMEEVMRGDEEEVEEVCTGWMKLAEKVVEVAKGVCGIRERRVENPWMVGKEEETAALRRSISQATERRNTAAVEHRRGEASEEELGERWEELREARKRWKRAVRSWERQWWDGVIGECVRAEEVGDTGGLYRGLKKMGMRDVKKAKQDTKITTPEFRDHFKRVSDERFENAPQDIEAAVRRVRDRRGEPASVEWGERMNRVPSEREIVEQMRKMRDSSPGEDGVRLSYLMKGGESVLREVVRIVGFMFREPVEKWEDGLKTGVVVPLYKMKGSRDDPNNFRGVCLLSMGSRVLARVLAVRLAA